MRYNILLAIAVLLTFSCSNNSMSDRIYVKNMDELNEAINENNPGMKSFWPTENGRMPKSIESLLSRICRLN